MSASDNNDTKPRGQHVRPEIGVFELFTTTSTTSDTGNALRFVRGDDPGLVMEAVLLGDSEKNLITEMNLGPTTVKPYLNKGVLTSKQLPLHPLDD